MLTKNDEMKDFFPSSNKKKKSGDDDDDDEEEDLEEGSENSINGIDESKKKSFQEKQEKNVRRRVYDALNVLYAAGVLQKHGKNVYCEGKYV